MIGPNHPLGSNNLEMSEGCSFCMRSDNVKIDLEIECVRIWVGLGERDSRAAAGPHAQFKSKSF